MVDTGPAVLYTNYMGYNKVILCLNDFDHHIDEDPVSWWQSCQAAFSKLSWKRDAFGPKMSHGLYQTQAVWQEHADVAGVIIVGGNYATVIGTGSACNGHHSEEAQIAILKEVLERKGYTIRKKPSRK